MKHYRAVVHIAAKDKREVERICSDFEKKHASLDPDAPYVTVLHVEPRTRAPGKRGWR